MAAAKKTSTGSSKKSTGTKTGKKTTTKKTSSAAKSKQSAGTASRGRGRPRSTPAPQPSTGLRMTRRMAGMLTAVIALLLSLSLVGLKGFLLNPLWLLFTGMIGWGIGPLVGILYLAAIMLLYTGLKPYRLRVVCTVAAPVLFSAVVQCVLIGDEMPMTFASVGALWKSGIARQSAGVLSGSLAIISGAALSQTGAKIILSLFMLVCIFTAIGRTPWGLASSFVRILEEERSADYLSEDDMTVSPREQQTEQPSENGSFWTRRRAKAKQKKALRQIEKAEREKAAAQNVPQEETEEFPDDETKREPSRREPEPQQVSEEVLPQSAPAAKKSAPSKFPDIDRMMDVFMDDEPTEEERSFDAAQRREKKAEQMAAAAAKKQMETELSHAMDDLQLPPYLPPSLDLLDKPRYEAGDTQADLDNRATQLVDTLDSFGIETRLYGRPIVGPTVTRFEIQVERGVKISRITSLTEDIGLALGSPNVRLFTVPEHGTVGIEVANHKSQTVFIRDVLASPQFQNSKADLPVALGKDITGQAMVIDLAKMPHLMIAGTTGSGKSVCINSLLISLMYKFSHEELRLIMIDPKMVELANYNGIPHLLIPVVTDAKKASGALSWAVGEMDRRYAQFAAAGVRKLEDYNDLMRRLEQEEQDKQAREDDDAPPFDVEEPAPKKEHKKSKVMPRIVIVIDELADLMMVASKEVEGYICRLAQKARAAGMYLVVATQRPSADVITGLMKSNIPSRIAFAVASGTESRIIMDTNGAEKLMGHGDMLYHPIGASEPHRIQGCFISTDEIERVIAHVKTTGAVEYSEEIQSHIEHSGGESGGFDGAGDEDPMLNDAISIVVSSGQASTSMLQRKLRLGYARAARVMDQMEERGIISPSEGSKPRRVLITKDEWMEIQLRRDI